MSGSLDDFELDYNRVTCEYCGMDYDKLEDRECTNCADPIRPSVTSEIQTLRTELKAMCEAVIESHNMGNRVSIEQADQATAILKRMEKGAQCKL